MKIKEKKMKNDPQLDFLSFEFDALQALKSENLKAPIENAELIDWTMIKYLLPSSSSSTSNLKISFPKKHENSEKTEKTKYTELLTMRYRKGPLGKLHQWMKNKSKVKIVVRELNKLRGDLVGFIQSYDKHFNIILKDAQELLYKKNVLRKLEMVFVKGDSVVSIYKLN